MTINSATRRRTSRSAVTSLVPQSQVTISLQPQSVNLAFFINHTPTTEIYTLSLHDALPISREQRSYNENVSGVREKRARRFALRAAATGRVGLRSRRHLQRVRRIAAVSTESSAHVRVQPRSEEHTSELQSLAYLVCRLLLEK